MKIDHHHSMAGLSNRRTPEEEHLAEQEHWLAELTEQLATKETEFATASAEFGRFRAAYLRRFAPLYQELDELEAEIARLLAIREDTPAAQGRAQAAASRASESEEAARLAGGAAIPSEPEFAGRAVDPELRDLYRRAAKLIHPDTAADDAERERRTRVMAAVNEAYARGDLEAIRRIIDGEAARPEAIEGDDVASRLVRTVRKIAQIRARFVELVQLEASLTSDAMWQLFADGRNAWNAGGDPLAEDEAALRARIASAKARLEALVSTGTQAQRGPAR